VVDKKQPPTSRPRSNVCDIAYWTPGQQTLNIMPIVYRFADLHEASGRPINVTPRRAQSPDRRHRLFNVGRRTPCLILYTMPSGFSHTLTSRYGKNHKAIRPMASIDGLRKDSPITLRQATCHSLTNKHRNIVSKTQSTILSRPSASDIDGQTLWLPSREYGLTIVDPRIAVLAQPSQVR